MVVMPVGGYDASDIGSTVDADVLKIFERNYD